MIGIEHIKHEPGVYFIYNRANRKGYIGSSLLMRERILDHIRRLTSGIHHNPHLQNAWSKYGVEAFEVWILSVLDKDNIRLIEEEWIGLLGTTNRELGYNLDSKVSGEGRLSEETKRKISAALIGRKQSPETIEKRAAKMRGRKRPKEFGESLRRMFRGVPLTEETKEKLRIAATGKVQSQETIEKRVSKLRGISLSEEHKAKLRKPKSRRKDD